MTLAFTGITLPAPSFSKKPLSKKGAHWIGTGAKGKDAFRDRYVGSRGKRGSTEYLGKPSRQVLQGALSEYDDWSYEGVSSNVGGRRRRSARKPYTTESPKFKVESPEPTTPAYKPCQDAMSLCTNVRARR